LNKCILYIAGRGNSGSTLLDIVLSQLLDFRSCGELLSGVYRLDTQPCSCGQPMNECSEWMPVDEKNQEDNKQLFDGIRNRGKFSKIPEAVFNRKAHKVSLKNEQEYLLTLCGERGGLVDSSKEISRSIYLSRGPSQACIVHLIRNPVALIVSARRRVATGKVIKINRRDYHWPTPLLFILDIFVCTAWVVSSALLYILNSRNRKRYCIIDYDDFTKKPVQTAVSLALHFQLNHIDKIPSRANDNQYTVGHLVGGNRMAASGVVSVSNKQDEVQAKLPSRIIYWLIAGLPYYLIKRSRYSLNNLQ